MAGARALIGITGRTLASDRITGWTKDAFLSGQPYALAVLAAGGAPVIIPPIGDPTSFGVDGIVLAGGADVDPSLYGEERHPACYGIDRELDDFELALTRNALDNGIPILAICRGCQLVNVALGGTLLQHITGRDDLGKHGDPASGSGVLHHVVCEPGSLVAKAMGVDRAVVHSHHHQAVDRLADGCAATAWTDDGLIEAFDVDAEGWAVAVQWHPEMTFADDPTQLALFEALVSESRDYAGRSRSARAH